MNKVILYTTHCPMCKMLKLQLDKANIEYEICDDVEHMKSLGFTKAPLLSVDGQIFQMKEALAWIKGNQ